MGDIMTRIAISSNRHSRFVPALSSLALAAAAVCVLASSAQAGFFDFMLGGGNRPAYAYSDPRADVTPRDEPRVPATTPSHSGSGAKAFCVRLCDGRYY